MLKKRRNNLIINSNVPYRIIQNYVVQPTDNITNKQPGTVHLRSTRTRGKAAEGKSHRLMFPSSAFRGAFLMLLLQIYSTICVVQNAPSSKAEVRPSVAGRQGSNQQAEDEERLRTRLVFDVVLHGVLQEVLELQDHLGNCQSN